ncbi:flippase [Exiguobacterium sp. 17-1]|uniref:flippase n=1 Tax=Exiguobacterium sp. 17-1 TaxID=2931981 RepID=UPI001FFE332A|nr:flippase [Exiguobacterium sp. 17-1]MCK2156179.1 flippase [Exiguobacterium sp. 17-1]
MLSFLNLRNNKVFSNSSWIISEKVFNLLISLVTIMIVSRYFGPEKFGLFNYSIAYITLFTAIATLGLEVLVVKAILDGKYTEENIISTSLFLRAIGGIVLLILSNSILFFINNNDFEIRVMVFILSISMIFKSFEVIDYLLQSKQNMKLVSVIKITSYSISAIFKILIVVYGGSIIDFSYAYLIESIIIAFLLILTKKNFFENKITIRIRHIDLKFAKYILNKSWPLIISGIMVSLYTRVDQIMIGNILDSSYQNGIYSAAFQISNIWYFVPLAIITSYTPLIMQNHRKDNMQYLNLIKRLYRIVIWISIIMAVLISLFGKYIVLFLYGYEYIDSLKILVIMIWSGIFAIVGSARGPWLICEGLQKYSLIYMSVGLVVNIILNLILIPIYKGEGAAIATLIAQICTVIVVPFAIPATRKSVKMMAQSFLFLK